MNLEVIKLLADSDAFWNLSMLFLMVSDYEKTKVCFGQAKDKKNTCIYIYSKVHVHVFS